MRISVWKGTKEHGKNYDRHHRRAAGSAGWHAGTIYTGMQDVTIKYVSDLYPQAAQQWGPMYGVQNVVSDAEIVFNDPEVQAVLFCTSTDTHADYIIRRG